MKTFSFPKKGKQWILIVVQGVSRINAALTDGVGATAEECVWILLKVSFGCAGDFCDYL